MNKNLFTCSIVVIAVAIFIHAFAGAQTWNNQVVDNAGDAGYSSRVAVTSDGTPYILYVTDTPNEVRLAWWVSLGDTSGGWNSTLVGNYSYFNYRSISICVDPYDDMHIAWGENNTYWPVHSYLKYAIYDTETKDWELPPEIVVSASEHTYFYPDLTLADSLGTIVPTIAYVSELVDTYGYTFKSAKRDPGTGYWSTDIIVDGRVGPQVSIAADSYGGLHVSFYEITDGDLIYATKSPGDTVWAWSYVDISDDVGLYSSIVIDNDDVPFIVYYDKTNGDLKYAKLLSE